MTSSAGVLQIEALPREIRTHILSYLLPDIPVIECDMDWSPMRESPPRFHSPRNWSPVSDKAAYKFRSDGEACFSEILRTSRRLYQDGRAFLYACKTYNLSVYDFGFDFLTQSDQLRSLPPLPYSEIKEFVITIAQCDFAETGHRLRRNLVWLCGLFQRYHVHFQNLKVVFLDERADWWRNAWDQTGVEDPEQPEEGENFFRLPNIHLAAWENGFHSTFAWMMTPLALLPTAHQCTIQVPPCLQERQHIMELIRWYEEGIDGTYSFPNDWCLQGDQEEFDWMWKHPHLNHWDLECECCKEFRMS